MVTIQYNGSTIATPSEGKAATLLCSNKFMLDDIVVEPNNSGAAGVFYNDKLISCVTDDKKARVLCKDKIVEHDIVVISEPKPSSGLDIQVYGGNYGYIQSVGTCTDVNVVIPPCLPDGTVIREINSHAFRYRFSEDGIDTNSVYIPFSVTTLDALAFDDCRTLTSITFSKYSQLDFIGENAFYGCTSLTSITLPDSITTIGYTAFAGSGITTINVPWSENDERNSSNHWGATNATINYNYTTE